MPSGVGPNIIIPGGQGMWKSITGQSVWDSQNKGLPPMFGTDPMGSGSRTVDWGKSGGFTSYGPQSTQYQKPGFALGDPFSAGGNIALYGHPYDPNAGQSAYERFNDAGDSYLRRYGTDLYGPQGNIIGLSPEHSAGLRSFQDLGGRDQSGNPLYGSQ